MATILVIDDSPNERAEIRRVVESAGLFGRIIEAEDGLAGLKLMLQEHPDVVLCDLEMPGLDGEKLLRMRDRGPGAVSLPFLFLTANTDDERKARLLEDGASDTITKPFHPADLLARLRLHLRLRNLERELREKNEMLTRLSLTDPLTGLHNRRYVHDMLSVEFLKAARYGTPLTLLMIDLDHFKRLNDEHGHLLGDEALVEVALVIAKMRRQTDVAARFGGEEFLLVLTHTEREGGVVLAERVRREIAALHLEAEGEKPIRITASVGVASYRSDHDTPEDLIAEADASLYRAKEAGRNRVEAGTRQ